MKRTSTPRCYRFDEQFDLVVARSAIGVGDPNALFRGGERDRLGQRQRRHREGMRGDDLRPKAARGSERGKLIRATERFAESLNPVFLERVLQLGDERTFHPSLYVMPMLRILGVAGPLICKPNAAGEANSVRQRPGRAGASGDWCDRSATREGDGSRQTCSRLSSSF